MEWKCGLHAALTWMSPELDYLAGSQLEQASLAEQYAGLAFED